MYISPFACLTLYAVVISSPVILSNLLPAVSFIAEAQLSAVIPEHQWCVSARSFQCTVTRGGLERRWRWQRLRNRGIGGTSCRCKVEFCRYVSIFFRSFIKMTSVSQMLIFQGLKLWKKDFSWSHFDCISQAPQRWQSFSGKGWILRSVIPSLL